MDEGAIEKAGITPIQPLPRSDRRRSPTRSRRRTRSSRCTSRASSVLRAVERPGLRRRDAGDREPRPERARPAGSQVLPRDQGHDPEDARRVPRAHGADVRAARQRRPRRRRPRTRSGSRPRSRSCSKTRSCAAIRTPSTTASSATACAKSAPSFPWADLPRPRSASPTVTAITVNDPAYYPAIAKLIATEKPAALRDYLTWNVLRGSADDLGKAWVDEAFSMQQVLSGVKELPPRWRRCVHRVDRDLGELLGQSYVKAQVRRRLEGARDRPDEGDPRRRCAASSISCRGWTTPTRAAREGEARQDGLPRRLSRQVARATTFPVDRATTTPANVRAAQQWERRAPAREDRQAGRSPRLGDDAADGQRVLRAVAQRDRAAGRPAAAAVLRRARSIPRSTSARPAAARSATR